MKKLKSDLLNYINSTYGIINPSTNLEINCDKSNECWSNYKTFSTDEKQKPYIPWIGNKYNGLLFLGINYNGGNIDLNYSEQLKEIAVEKYLSKNKYLIFKQPGYRGSPFWYYIALLGFLYNEYTNSKIKYSNEYDIGIEQISSGYDYCSFTNIIKCSTSNNDRSIPNSMMFDNCSNKLFGELNILKPKIIFSFTRYTYPNFINILKSYYKILKPEKEINRSRITAFEKFIFIETEHPLSTVITRTEKFNIYSNLFYDNLNSDGIDLTVT